MPLEKPLPSPEPTTELLRSAADFIDSTGDIVTATSAYAKAIKENADAEENPKRASILNSLSFHVERQNKLAQRRLNAL